MIVSIFIINHFCATGGHVAYFLLHLGNIVLGKVKSNNLY